MKIARSMLSRIATVLVCTNFFYITAFFNYKILFIAGSYFLVKRMKIKWLIAICCFVIIQFLLIWVGSSNSLDRVFVLISTILVGVGYLGWVSFLISSRAYDIPLLGYLVILLASYILHSNAFSIDPLILVLIALISFNEKASHFREGLGRLVLFCSGLIYSVLVGWRSAVLALMVGFAYSIYTNSKLIPKMLLLVLCAVLVVYALSYALNILDLLIETGSGGDPSSGRLAMISSSLSVIFTAFMDFDIRAYIGRGLGAFGEDFSKSMLLVVDVLGIEITSLYEAEGETRLHAHNFILQNLYEFGLTGIIIQFTLIFKMFNTLKNYRVCILMGMASGLLSGTFYIYSEYFIALYALYMFKANEDTQKNANL